VGTTKDGTTTWSMDLVAKTSPTGAEHRLHSVDLGKEPKKLGTFEAAAATKLSNGTYAVAARHQGALVVLLLDRNKRRSALRTYRDGHPSIPSFPADGLDHLILGSQKNQDRWSLGTIRLSVDGPKLPPKLDRPRVDVGLASLAQPTLARAGDRRWLAFQGGDRRRSELWVAPVDATLASIGRGFRVSEGPVYESQILGISDDRLLVVHLTNPQDGPSSVVAVTLACGAA
jgi:hypothetical protein